MRKVLAVLVATAFLGATVGSAMADCSADIAKAEPMIMKVSDTTKKTAAEKQITQAKDAAKIFDRLDMRVLIEVASQINPRRMSDIMAQMQPEAAERLTIELAARAKESGTGNDLPKIEGRQAGN